MGIPIFHWTIERTLQLLGFWPNKPNPIPQLLLCSTVVVIVPFQLWDAYNTVDNPPLMMDGLGDFFSDLLLLVKFFIVWCNKRSVFSLIEEITEDWEKLILSEDQEFMEKYVKYAYLFCKCDYSLYMSAIVFYYPETLLSYIVKPVEERKLVLKVVYPFEYRPSPIFEIITIVQTGLIVLMISADALSESLLGTLVCHSAGLIEILVNDINEVSAICNSISERRLSKLIKNIVNRHQKLINMLDKIESVYTYVCLVQFFSSTILICAAGFVILSSMGTIDLILVGKYIMFIVLMIWQAFAFCFAGEFLKTKSLSIPQSIYNCSWYEMTPKNIKLLTIVMMRTQEPLQLTIGKFTELSIGSFTNIVKTSASYLSVLQRMY